MKILIVDDSKAMRAIVRRALAASPTYASAEIVEAVDGSEALGLIPEVDRAKANGARFLVSKPFTPEALVSALDGAL